MTRASPARIVTRSVAGRCRFYNLIETDCRPDAFIRPRCDEFPVFRLSVALCKGECKRSTIWLKKKRVSLRLS